MTPDEYQALAMRTAGPALTPQHALTLTALGLTGEAGEFADMIKKHLFHGHTLDVDKAAKELGDMLWYVARGCTALGLSLDNIMEENIAKLKARYPEGFSEERSRARVEYIREQMD